MTAVLGYAATILVYFFTYNIFAIGLNVQFGYAGILDFTVITFMAAGGYVAGVMALPKATPGSGIHYILGLSQPFLISLVVGVAGAALLGALIGMVALKRLRSDYLAIVTLATGTIVYGIVGNSTSLFDGYQGLFGVPPAFGGALPLSLDGYTYLFIAISFVCMAAVWAFANRLYASPLGRAMRSVREDIDVAEAFGKNTYRVRMTAMVIGCAIVGLGGVLTIFFISALSPAGWSTGETFVVWAALLVGGRGNNRGAVVGSLLVAVIFNEATRYLPQVPGAPNLIPDLRNIIIGALVIATLWFRPQGVVPERKHRILELPPRKQPSPARTPASATGTAHG